MTDLKGHLWLLLTFQILSMSDGPFYDNCGRWLRNLCCFNLNNKCPSFLSIINHICEPRLLLHFLLLTLIHHLVPLPRRCWCEETNVGLFSVPSVWESCPRPGAEAGSAPSRPRMASPPLWHEDLSCALSSVCSRATHR